MRYKQHAFCAILGGLMSTVGYGIWTATDSTFVKTRCEQLLDAQTFCAQPTPFQILQYSSTVVAGSTGPRSVSTFPCDRSDAPASQSTHSSLDDGQRQVGPRARITRSSHWRVWSTRERDLALDLSCVAVPLRVIRPPADHRSAKWRRRQSQATGLATVRTSRSPSRSWWELRL